MPTPKFNWFSPFLSVVCLVAGLATGWGAMKTRVDNVESSRTEMVQTFRKDIQELQVDLRGLRDAVIELKTEFRMEREFRKGEGNVSKGR